MYNPSHLPKGSTVQHAMRIGTGFTYVLANMIGSKTNSIGFHSGPKLLLLLWPLYVVGISCFALIIVGCSNGEPRIIYSKDYDCRVTVEPGWRKTDRLHPTAMLQLHRGKEECYLVVMGGFKSDWDFGTYRTYKSLDDLVSLAKKDRAERLESFKLGETRKLTLNGSPAVQFEYSGISDSSKGINCAYIQTFVETRAYVFEIVTWTKIEMLEQNREKLDAVIAKFEQTPPPDQQ